ncbi:hypothetical protein BXZ70DRAFT_91625 [Cristinia sonorae]|uniref:Uncharacterized protein n=1 Tax=Cristinia sonorae TaxID=1940300 RepID=A0A8K0XQS7_9AGAR|nr:hypothetical protein BXZ70DRAFT_91625 [Cristinia sonorae]
MDYLPPASVAVTVPTGCPNRDLFSSATMVARQLRLIAQRVSYWRDVMSPCPMTWTFGGACEMGVVSWLCWGDWTVWDVIRCAWSVGLAIPHTRRRCTRVKACLALASVSLYVNHCVHERRQLCDALAHSVRCKVQGCTVAVIFLRDCFAFPDFMLGIVAGSFRTTDVQEYKESGGDILAPKPLRTRVRVPFPTEQGPVELS